jgi:hypothetical protein
MDGIDGIDGLPGDTGPKGLPGPTGAKGEAGVIGATGNNGTPGEPGPGGAPVAPGKNGMNGLDGKEAPKGEPGLPRVKGDTGSIGIGGEPGSSGKDGVKGEPGIPGRDGLNGLPGITGLKGEPGTSYIEENDQRSKNRKQKITYKKNIDDDDNMMQTESSKGNQTDTGLPESFNQFGEDLKYKLAKMHEQIILSQTNGLLAASAIGLPVCSRIQGLGQTMLLQQCAVKTVALTAIETECGFQPFFKYANENYTVGMDGWSIHPYSACFCKSHFVNLNGNAFTWEHNATNGEWIKQNPTIHTHHLELKAEFEELLLNDFDLALKDHQAHDVMKMKQLNILNNLVGQLYGAEKKLYLISL